LWGSQGTCCRGQWGIACQRDRHSLALGLKDHVHGKVELREWTFRAGAWCAPLSGPSILHQDLC
jgi:hypothetical protein